MNNISNRKNLNTYTRVMVVTGAAGGIGSALCHELLNRGYAVFATDISENALEALKISINPAHQHSFACRKLDVTSLVEFCQLSSEACDHFGHIDGIINNAGIFSSASFIQCDESIWARVMNVNLMGTVNGCKAALPYLLHNPGAQIINVASTAGLTPILHGSAYASSKHAVVGFTRSLRQELQPLGINVQLVVPGLIDTGIFDRALDVGISSRKTIDKAPIGKWPASKAAKKMADGIASGDAEIVFPLVNRLMLILYRLFPKMITRMIIHSQRRSMG